MFTRLGSFDGATCPESHSAMLKTLREWGFVSSLVDTAHAAPRAYYACIGAQRDTCRSTSTASSTVDDRRAANSASSAVPRWAIAHKFPARPRSRRSTSTSAALVRPRRPHGFAPVFVGGVTVTNATLHNADQSRASTCASATRW